MRKATIIGIVLFAGVLVGFRGQVITYNEFNIFASINSLGYAVIGGLGFALGAVFAAPNAIGGIGTRVIEDWIGLGAQWDLILGSLLVFVILIVGVCAGSLRLASHLTTQRVSSAKSASVTTSRRPPL